jgi:hypothetical protein
MKVAINACFGGFSLSPEAVELIAKWQGKKCYFFKHEYTPDHEIKHSPITKAEASKGIFWTAFTVPNPDEVVGSEKNWHQMTDEEKAAHNAAWDSINIESGRELNRTDPLLIRVIEKLGKKAGDKFSELRIVEIPDGTEYEIDEYDGNESIHEVHRSWR